jgi:hypothetical protein
VWCYCMSLALCGFDMVARVGVVVAIVCGGDCVGLMVVVNGFKWVKE